MSPMLAKKFEQGAIQYPVISQPKIDGIRCFIVKGQFFTRNGNKIVNIPIEIKNAIPENIVLDGELYSDKLPFEELTGLLRTQTYKNDAKKVKLALFDMVNGDKQTDRLECLKRMKFKTRLISILPSIVLKSDNAVQAALKAAIKQGHEGIILRNPHGYYEYKRSDNLVKVKEFKASEFLIVGVEEGKGKAKQTPIWICQTKSGESFKVKHVGEFKTLVNLFNNANKIIGEQLTVKYQNLTSRGVPRFPTGVCIRNYE